MFPNLMQQENTKVLLDKLKKNKSDDSCLINFSCFQDNMSLIFKHIPKVETFYKLQRRG